MQLQGEVEEDSILHFLGADLIRGVLEEETLTIPVSHEQPPFIHAQMGGGSGTAAFFSHFQSPFPITSPTPARTDPVAFPPQPSQRHESVSTLHVERIGIGAMHAGEQGNMKDTVEQYKQLVQHNQQQHQRQYEYMQQQRKQQQHEEQRHQPQRQHIEKQEQPHQPQHSKPQPPVQNTGATQNSNNPTKPTPSAVTFVSSIQSSVAIAHLRGGGEEADTRGPSAAAAPEADMQVHLACLVLPTTICTCLQSYHRMALICTSIYSFIYAHVISSTPV
jgi:hypothetical protein